MAAPAWSELELARALRRRRLQLLAAQWRKAREDYAAALRSRRQRAKLLRLARRHRLAACLKRLRPPGMILERAGGRACLAYDAHATRCYRRTLAAQLGELRRQARQLGRGEVLATMAANLQTLLAESQPSEQFEFGVRWTLDGVVLEEVWIGDLEVHLNLASFDVRVINTAEGGGGRHFPHPHVASDGAVCWNGHDEEAQAYHDSGDFLALRDLIENLLRTYNPASPYITLKDWAQESGPRCQACDEPWSEEELAWSDACRGELCPDCRHYCERCGDFVYWRDYDEEMGACQRCREQEARACAGCGALTWLEELEEHEAHWFGRVEAAGLCPACHEALLAEEETKEQSKEDEDDDETADDLAQSPRLVAS